jgi:hypothetical protein
VAWILERLGNLFRRLTEKPPGMIGTPPSARQIPADPVAHARQFANEYVDILENYVEGRMHALGIAEHHIGLPDLSRRLPWATFHPNGTTGGSVIGPKIAVNSGVFNLELLRERYGSEVAETRARSRLRDRIDAVMAHEIAEAQTGTHEGAEELAAMTDLPVSKGARRILRSMSGRRHGP